MRNDGGQRTGTCRRSDVLMAIDSHPNKGDIERTRFDQARINGYVCYGRHGSLCIGIDADGRCGVLDTYQNISEGMHVSHHRLLPAADHRP